ncbi:hypothetical protein AQUCO_02800226v1 [Aquilegia coerulea]|uniref:Protein kinase domain-containing protein n=1 Tax=Aquilegia coerulea TaxID=218851 RepID=A0A2G5D4G6_AQUCA|nr:hypothetical protein AQUCO_02800226v1 [Aquilegia coerulea]
MEYPSNLAENSNVLLRLLVDLKRTKDQVAIRGEWHMGAWLKNVRDRERQVDYIMKEFNEKTAGFFQNNLDTEDKLNSKLIESLAAVKVLIEEGNAGSESIPDHLNSLEKYQLKLFSSEDLKKFTDFNKILGSGGYSIVYQGEFEGDQVAVKVLKENSMVYETFLSERITMGRISHTNLVKLHGFCFDDDRKALVYEYMEKGSLDEILYKNPNSVEWTELYHIALQIARGLAYLHHDCGEQIIHHDIKAANVLLDKNLCPKITDFGVSNLMRNDATHITNTRTRGTDCYSAPEIYQPSFPITSKCDVYSFGIMMFEILGRRCSIPKGKIWFPEEVSNMFNKQPETIMEYCGIMENDREKAMILLMVAMWCAQYTPPIRPSMSEVVEVLEKEMSVMSPPYPFHHHNPLGFSMVHSEVPVNDISLAPSNPTPVAVPDMFINAYKQDRIKEVLEKYHSKELNVYSRMDLEVFTSGFSESNIIGTGGVGTVYRGISQDGVEVAVKVFADNDNFEQDVFMTEVRTMSTLYHKNIVKTYGYCFDNETIALIYEYIPWGSLDKILYMNHLSIEWGRLYDIVIEIAKGLCYLHDGYHHQIIHFDIKPSNILLNKNLTPKIKSVGLAKIMARNESHFDLTRIRGTVGYNAPETWMPGSKVTHQADVFSFGMMMFEVLGMRNNINKLDRSWFPERVWEKFETGQIEQLIEELGITRENREDAKILSMVALWCAQYIPHNRPSMRTVVKMLEKKLPVTPPSYPFEFSSSRPSFLISLDDDSNTEDLDESESESILQLYEKMCPPGGENSVIIYTTAIEKMKRSFKESNDVRSILQSHQIKMIEREVWDYEDELKTFVGGIVVPVLFVKGRLIGGADEVNRLEAQGKLKVLLYGIPTEDDEAKKSSELLQLFEEKCPPGGEKSVIIYTTTIERMRRPFEESNNVRAILLSHQIKMIERDVWGDDQDYEDELVDVLGKILVPVLFVKGRFIGAADEVNKLEAEGKLKVLLYGMPAEE